MATTGQRDRRFFAYKPGGVSSDDGNAIVKLNANLESREQAQEEMKAVNSYYRKNGTLHGCPLLTPEDIAKLEAEMARSFRWAPSQGAWQRMLTQNGLVRPDRVLCKAV